MNPGLRNIVVSEPGVFRPVGAHRSWSRFVRRRVPHPCGRDRARVPEMTPGGCESVSCGRSGAPPTGRSRVFRWICGEARVRRFIRSACFRFVGSSPVYFVPWRFRWLRPDVSPPDSVAGRRMPAAVRVSCATCGGMESLSENGHRPFRSALRKGRCRDAGPPPMRGGSGRYHFRSLRLWRMVTTDWSGISPLRFIVQMVRAMYFSMSRCNRL